MKIVRTILHILLIAQFTFFGLSKIVGSADMLTTFAAFGFPGWVRILVGLVEITAVACLVYGFWKKQFVLYGAILLFVMTIGATFCHLILEGSVGNAIPPVIVFLQTGIVLWLHKQENSQQQTLSFG